jgi:tetratricopeptide (TPR) repeat protein
MQSAVDMNNEAAFLIEKGHYKASLSLLSRGLEIVQSELDGQDDNDDDDDDDAMMNGFESVYSCRDMEEIKARRQLFKFENLAPDQYFIYSHPIHATNLDEHDQEYVMSVIIVFNMALAHHQIALQLQSEDCGEDYEMRLLGALKLYQLGFCMQMKGDVHMDMTYALAMVNNTAQIYKAMNRQQKAQKFFTHMVSSLMMMIENGEAESVDELDGFLWNASQLILKEAVAAAA